MDCIQQSSPGCTGSPTADAQTPRGKSWGTTHPNRQERASEVRLANSGRLGKADRVKRVRSGKQGGTGKVAQPKSHGQDRTAKVARPRSHGQGHRGTISRKARPTMFGQTDKTTRSVCSIWLRHSHQNGRTDSAISGVANRDAQTDNASATCPVDHDHTRMAVKDWNPIC